ncbi:hypothetical protein PTI98_000445 [Pleurotus ostreatus]|nr:hypothetical protein PTI98_000445 [Pleurotus ostreatus]
MKIWECFDNLPAQQWFLTADDRIALENQGTLYLYFQDFCSTHRQSLGLCLDLTNGNVTNGNQVQTWQCTDNDINQAWRLQV